ncbi:Uncharacterised protein [Legionella beliardensis]|uniref:Uncharacterized protein n=1 Tax=Legionella beliardensis TaxID=91822 RepID=A0A378I4C9_9GAMM|nr:hypothetical protein [Legionella beliardensis]STX29575.1 Uncharacterised protein [Legionella beliardensis]
MGGKKFKGNYNQAVNALPKSVPRELFNGDNSAGSDPISIDLHRGGLLFVNSNGKTWGDFENAWLAVDRSSYVQGDIVAQNKCSYFKDLIIDGIINPPSISKDPYYRNEQVIDYLQLSPKGKHISIAFAYCDDEGNYCGVALETSTADPNYWIASVSRKTTEPRKDHDETILMNFGEEEINEDLLGGSYILGGLLGDGSKSSISSASDDLREALNSVFIANLLKDIFNEDNSINVEKLAKLQELLPQVNNLTDEARAQLEVDSFFDKARRFLTKNRKIIGPLGGAALGSIIGAIVGSVVPVVGTAIGAAFGAAIGGGLGVSGAGLYDLYRKQAAVGTILTTVGSAGLGAGVGAVLGTFIFPGIGTGIGAAIGAGVGAAVSLAGTGIYNIWQKNRATGTALTTVGSAGIGAGVGALLGTVAFPGVGTAIGAAIGAGVGASVSLAGTGLYNAFTNYPKIGTALTTLGSTGIGMAVGALLGTIIPIPGIGTLVGMGIGAGVGAAIPVLTGLAVAGVQKFNAWRASRKVAENPAPALPINNESGAGEPKAVAKGQESDLEEVRSADLGAPSNSQPAGVSPALTRLSSSAPTSDNTQKERLTGSTDNKYHGFDRTWPKPKETTNVSDLVSTRKRAGSLGSVDPRAQDDNLSDTDDLTYSS